MARKEIFRLRLTESERAVLDEAKDAGGFPSVAAFIRDAAERQIAQSKPLPGQIVQSRPDPQ